MVGIDGNDGHTYQEPQLPAPFRLHMAMHREGRGRGFRASPLLSLAQAVELSKAGPALTQLLLLSCQLEGDTTFHGSELFSNAPVCSSPLLRCTNPLQVSVHIISFSSSSIFQLLSNRNAFNSHLHMLDLPHSFGRDFQIAQAYLNPVLVVILTCGS